MEYVVAVGLLVLGYMMLKGALLVHTATQNLKSLLDFFSENGWPKKDQPEELKQALKDLEKTGDSKDLSGGWLIVTQGLFFVVVILALLFTEDTVLNYACSMQFLVLQTIVWSEIRTLEGIYNNLKKFSEDPERTSRRTLPILKAELSLHSFGPVFLIWSLRISGVLNLGIGAWIIGTGLWELGSKLAENIAGALP